MRGQCRFGGDSAHLALTAAIWHNETTDRHGPARNLIAYDH